MILPEALELSPDEAGILISDKQQDETAVQRFRNIVMYWKQGAELSILACENQKTIHYAMPVRTMLYNSLSYTKQMEQLWKSHTKSTLAQKEFLSRFRKDDRLSPVISLVFYYGLEDWDSSTDLYDMLHLKDRPFEQDLLRRFIPNYHINLFDVGKIQNTNHFHIDLHLIFGMLKYRDNKKTANLCEYP